MWFFEKRVFLSDIVVSVHTVTAAAEIGLFVQPSMHPGDCWLFAGHSASAIVQLATAIYPSEVTIEHLPRSMLRYCVR